MARKARRNAEAVQGKRSEAVLKEVERLEKVLDIAKTNTERQGGRFVRPSKEDLIRHIRGEASSASPFFTGLGWWPNSVPRGGTLHAQFYVYNPDPVGHGSLFVSLTFGPTNYISDSGISLTARDQRWAVYSTPYFVLAPSGSYAATFDVEIPTTIPASGYQGGAFLWKGNYFGIGTLFQRALLDFVVT